MAKWWSFLRCWEPSCPTLPLPLVRSWRWCCRYCDFAPICSFLHWICAATGPPYPPIYLLLRFSISVSNEGREVPIIVICCGQWDAIGHVAAMPCFERVKPSFPNDDGFGFIYWVWEVRGRCCCDHGSIWASPLQHLFFIRCEREDIVGWLTTLFDKFAVGGLLFLISGTFYRDFGACCETKTRAWRKGITTTLITYGERLVICWVIQVKPVKEWAIMLFVIIWKRWESCWWC